MITKIILFVSLSNVLYLLMTANVFMALRKKRVMECDAMALYLKKNKKKRVVVELLYYGQVAKVGSKVVTVGDSGAIQDLYVDINNAHNIVWNKDKRFVTGDILIVDGYIDAVGTKFVLHKCRAVIFKNKEFVKQYLVRRRLIASVIAVIITWFL